MANTTGLHRLTPLERQVLMHEMFSFCECIDYCVINQYFPFVEYKAHNLKLPVAAQRMVMRDFKDLKDAGVIDYKYNENEKWFESKECDYVLKIPENADEKRKAHLKRLNIICRFVNEIMGYEKELRDMEYEKEIEMDEDVLDYMLDFQHDFKIDTDRLNDYDLYRYDDPYVIEYIKIRGKTNIKEIKEDFELLMDIGYLYYEIEKRRFCMPEFDSFIEARRDYGVVRGEDGKLYI